MAYRLRADPGPDLRSGNGRVVGVDLGVAVSAALSTGELLPAPDRTAGRRKGRESCNGGSPVPTGLQPRRQGERAIAKLKPTRERDRRKDWVEKTSTDLARRFDLIRVEDLDVQAKTRTRAAPPSSRVSESPRNAGSTAVSAERLRPAPPRLEHKACSRSSQSRPHTRRNMLRVRARRTRKPQESSGVRVRSLHAGRCNADVNAAGNIAAGRAVTARGDRQ